MIGRILELLFGGERNIVRETAEVFTVNAEAQAIRDTDLARRAAEQFAAEFAAPQRGRFDRFVDGLNRLPRPALALGTLGLMVAAMVDPLWFAARMQGIALVPEPLWWLLGVIVSFYFGARHQAKVQDLQRDLAATMARAPVAMRNAAELERLRARQEADPDADRGLMLPDDNPALRDWREMREK